jgi:hypothetical protein
MTSEFDTINVDIPEDVQHQLVELYVRTYFSPPSIETFMETRHTSGIEQALYIATINEMVLDVTAITARKTVPPNPDKP